MLLMRFFLMKIKKENMILCKDNRITREIISKDFKIKIGKVKNLEIKIIVNLDLKIFSMNL